jgi:hypothetical protein
MAQDAGCLRSEMSSGATPLFVAHRRQAERAASLVFAIYGLCFFRLCQIVGHWSEIRQWKGAALLWPVAWMKRLPQGLGADLLFPISLAVGLWVLLQPLNRWARVAFAGCYLQALALSLSLAKISHSDHVSLWVALLLCLAPHGNPQSFSRIRFRAGWLSVFAGCQYLVALFYSLAGAWKLLGFLRAPPGWVSLLDFGGLGYSIGVKAGQTGKASFIGHALAAWPWLSTIGVWVILYLQLFSLVAVTRPRTHRIWGVGLIFFHLVTLIGMEVPFLQTIPMLALLWIGSPFVPEGSRLTTTLAELPLIRLAMVVVGRIKKALGEIHYTEDQSKSFTT